MLTLSVAGEREPKLVDLLKSIGQATQRIVFSVGNTVYQTDAQGSATAVQAMLKTCGLAPPSVGETFKDCDDVCPEMVVVPAGSFLMGSPENELLREAFDKGSESPQHKVTILKAFAVGKYAITRAQFSAFIHETGRNAGPSCRTLEDRKPEERTGRSFRNPGFEQTDWHPAVCVSWNDAEAYASWLSRKTGKIYRLLTEAEREYATRAGSEGPFWWGTEISWIEANYDGTVLYKPGEIADRRDKWGITRERTVAVDSFKPNPWGLYNVHGNVIEWVEDCWHPNYVGAPSDGRAWIGGDCRVRASRGGSWVYGPELVRAAARTWDYVDGRFSNAGFRLARTLN